MDVGISCTFTGEHYLNTDDYVVPHGADYGVYKREVTLARLAEPLGFDSLWSVEHHFSSYSMMPDVLQFLAYMAGQTTRIRLGSMVAVLPWHNPVRLAGAVSMLDNLSDGRYVLGIGRGLGRIEFEGMGVPMDESRERFVEGARLLLDGLEQGCLSSDGEFYPVPKSALRPAPVRSFRGRTYASAVSPESFDIMARLGIGLMIIPQKPWDAILADVKAYTEAFQAINGTEPPAPKVVNYIFCDEDPGRAKELGQRYIGEYWEACAKHYELKGDHFAKSKGYEYYREASKKLEGRDSQQMAHWYADLQCYGTPEQCVERAVFLKEELNGSELIGIFSYSDMPLAEASRSVHLFAEKVVPRLKQLGMPAAPARARPAAGPSESLAIGVP